MKLGKRQWPVWLWIVHGGILINFLLQMGYAAAMVFLVIMRILSSHPTLEMRNTAL